MPKFSNITFEDKEKLSDSTKKNLSALTFMQSHWGPVNDPIEITKETLKDKFGFYDSDNEDDWMQAYNFGTYSDNLEIFRVANLTNTPTFDGVTELLTSVSGSSHSHLFINTADQTSLHSVWHETNNGSNLLYHKNDIEEKTNEPSFAATQIMMIHGKYVGDEGNNIGISIASYLDDIKNEYIFKEYFEVEVSDITGFSVDDNVMGLTSKAIGVVKRILNNVLYINVSSGEFEIGETIFSSDVVISNINNKTTNVTLQSYAHGATVGDVAYFGGVYYPKTDRIYLIPYGQCDEANWHYIDCSDGTIVSYAHGATVVDNGYMGGVYDPINKRIYLVPFAQASAANWHYIDCETGNVVAYAHGIGTFLSSTAYSGGTYSPIQKKIYFSPYNQGPYEWHYVDCTDGSIGVYNSTLGTAGINAYLGSVLSPTQNRIYLVPYDQASEANWHYVDCDNNTVVAYAHGATVVNFAYSGGVYSPFENKIYFVPAGQADETNWHYINCATGTIVSYAHGATVVDDGYANGFYDVDTNRIYFSPTGQADETNWHYINCATGTIVSYAHGGSLSNLAFGGIVKSPNERKLYFVPLEISDEANWYYLNLDIGYDLTITNDDYFTTTETVIGYTSGATGTIDSIAADVLTVTGVIGTFVTGEYIYKTNAIASIIDKDLNINFNETFFDRAKRNLDINEICVAVTKDNVIKEFHILSMDSTADNYVEFINSNYIGIIVPSNYTIASSTDDLATKQSKAPIKFSNEKLQFGNTGFSDLSANDIATQLELLKDKYITNSLIIFSENTNQTIQNKIYDIVNTRNDCFGIINYYGTPIRDYETLFDSKNMCVFRTYKKQYNIFSETISTYGVSGDVAGRFIDELNNFNFNDIYGIKNPLNNILSINEYTTAETNSLHTQSYNVISRNKTVFYINGNYTTVSNKNRIDSKMSIRIMILYIIKRMNIMFDNELSSEMNQFFINRIIREMEDIKDKTSKYLRNLEYYYEIIGDEFYLHLSIGPHDIIESIKFLISEII